jgi:FAD/FMN-containing dehydrogenase
MAFRIPHPPPPFGATSEPSALADRGRHQPAPLEPQATAGHGQACDAAPPDFPPSIEVHKRPFENWSHEIRVDDVWICTPLGGDDVVRLANWASDHGWQLRPCGRKHGFSPLVVGSQDAENLVLVDLTEHLTAVSVNDGPPPSVTAQAGATIESVLLALREAGYGLAATPATGDLSLGGVLAIGAHGTGVPTSHGDCAYGSWSDLVVSLTAVVWDPPEGAYVLKALSRSDPDSAALLVHLGRGFIVEATLRVGEDTCLRCQSRWDIAAAEVFAVPDEAGPDAFAAHVERCGRVEATWFPFTAAPWMKLWSQAPERPWSSRPVRGPYNFPFTDGIAPEVSDLLCQITAGNSRFTPAYCNGAIAVIVSGLLATGSADIWGPSMNLLLYVRPTTLRMTTSGYAIVTRRAEIQRVVSEFYAHLSQAIGDYQRRDQYPINGPLEVRVTGLDDAGAIDIPGAVGPLLSPAQARADRGDWDAAVWLDLLTVPGTPHANQFYQEMETWIFEHFDGEYATARPEWSKGWAYTVGGGAWTDASTISTTIPQAFRAGHRPSDAWDAARSRYEALDPQRIFTNALLDALLPATIPQTPADPAAAPRLLPGTHPPST